MADCAGSERPEKKDGLTSAYLAADPLGPFDDIAALIS